MDLLRSLPIGLYLEQPVTWLHKLDARVKLIWLMSFLLAPLLANPYWRLALVALLIILTICAAIPLRVWKQQMGWLIFLCILVFFITMIAPDGLVVNYQPRLPDSEILTQVSDYQYVLFKESILFDRVKIIITRRSLDLAIRISTLLFTLVYSSNLYLLTTAPEEITAGLENIIRPIQKFKIPITEILLTLTLSLRFIPLVLEEIQNLTRSIRTRAINWKKLGVRKSFNLWLLVSERLLENLLRRAQQISLAMEVRGFTSPNKHRVQWHQFNLFWGDGLAIGILIFFWWLRIMWGGI